MKPHVENATKPSICFVAHHAYGAISGRPTGHIGGIERQQALMARWLAARGYRVSLLTWDEGQADEQRIAGVRVIKMCRRDRGLPGVRFFHPRWTSLVRAMRRADADVYYQNCGEYVTGQVAAWCRRHHRKFVYSVASDPDVDPALPMMKGCRERVLYRYGLRRADRVIAQTRYQQQRLLEGWGVESVVIPMPCPGPAEVRVPRAVPRGGSEPPRVLWIGRIGTEKRLEWLLEVAARCPDVQFEIVGGPYHAEREYAENLLQRARSLRNVAVHGYVPYDQTPRFYREAALLCCTSVFEGFPNTFLEAWSHAVPVVSTFDPDGLIAARRLGAVAKDVAGLIAAIEDLLASPQRYTQASRNARRYYLENHTVEAVMPRFEAVFVDVWRGAVGSQRERRSA